jgi:hypothetical protein
MSGYDLGIWFSNVAMNRDQAAAFCKHIYRDWVVVRRHPSFDVFWNELHARFPDGAGEVDPVAGLDSPPRTMCCSLQDIRSGVLSSSRRTPRPAPISLDDTVWASGPLGAMGSATILSVAWSRAVDVVPQIQDLAIRNGLVVFDGQSGEVTLPPGLGIGVTPEARLRLEVAGAVPPFDVSILLDGRPVAAFLSPSRMDAHERARSMTLQQELPLYEVIDPGSLAQLPRPKPLSVDDPDLGEVGKLLLGFDTAPEFPSGSK